MSRRRMATPALSLAVLLAVSAAFAWRHWAPVREAPPPPLWKHAAPENRTPVVTFSPDGRMVAAGTKRIRFWRTSDGKLLRTIDPGYKVGNGVISIALSPDGRMVAIGGSNGGGVWRLSDGQQIRPPQPPPFPWVRVAFCPTSDLVAADSRDGKVTLWQIGEGSRRTLAVTRAGWDAAIAFSPDGRTLATAQLKTIHLWRVSDGSLIRTFASTYDRTMALAFSPDGKTLAASDGRRIGIWRVADGQLLRTLEGDSLLIVSLAYSPEGRVLVSGAFDPQNYVERNGGELRLWRTVDGRLLHTYATPGVFSVAISPDGRLLAYGLGDGTTVLVRLPTLPF